MKKRFIVLLSFFGVCFADECHDLYFSHQFDKALDVCQQKANNASIIDNWEAPLILGNMFERGYGVKTNFNNAEYWYQMSASRGNCTAMSILQLMYMNQCNVSFMNCQGSKSNYWGNVMAKSCPVNPNNPNFISNNTRYYSLVSQNRPQDFLPSGQ